MITPAVTVCYFLLLADGDGGMAAPSEIINLLTVTI